VLNKKIVYLSLYYSVSLVHNIPYLPVVFCIGLRSYDFSLICISMSAVVVLVHVMFMWPYF
jgi:tryptophan-rich sensory protein